MAVRTIILLLYLAVLPLKAAELVLCLEPDRMSLKHMAEPCGDPGTTPPGEEREEPAAASLASTQECCPCVDVPLAGDPHSQHLIPVPKAHKADFPPAFDLPQPETLPAFNEHSDRAYSAPPELNSILQSIRSVVLLI